MPRRILITRSSHQASELAERLRALGVEPVLIPTIELTEPTSFDELDSALAKLDNFHWLLFTSANAVEAFHRRLMLTHPHFVIGPSSDKSPVLIAAIGPATARALDGVGFHVNLIPPKAVAESLVEALLPHALQPGNTPTRFLLLRAEQARDHLPATLRAAGADVTIAPAYRTVIPASSIPAVKALFSAPANYPDAITFTSSSTATNLMALLDAAGLTLPPEIQRISIGPITSQTLRELGLSPHAEATEPTIFSLVKTVAELLDLKRSMSG